MANRNFYEKLKRLFSGEAIVRYAGKNKLKVVDPSHMQSIGNKEGTRSIDRFTRLHPSSRRNLYGSSGYNSVYGNSGARIEIFTDYECISGDTIIPMLDGNDKTIKELAKLYPTINDKFYVYSYDHKTDSIVIGNAHSVRKTKTELTYKVIFDDGKEIIATKDHPFLMRDGNYKKLHELKENDSVMTFYQKHLFIVSIEEYKVIDVYDMTVEKYHNFATDSCFVHNSMDKDPILSSALDIYSDESTTKSDNGDILVINSDNQSIYKILHNLFYDILNIEFNLWPWIRNLVKYGDFYLLMKIKEDLGIINVQPLSVYSVIREETDDERDGFKVRFNYEGDLGKAIFENYEIAHFRLLSDTNFLPYGKSVIEGARREWKRLSMMEDAMLISRIMRAPERRVFKIDIGNIPPDEIDSYMNTVIEKMKQIPYIDEVTGDYNLKFNLQNMLEDYFLPVRGGQSGTEIETLSGMEWNGIDDIEYIKNKMMAALKIPKSFLGYDEGVEGKCLSPDTKIPLLNGEVKTIKEIADDFINDSNIDLWCYSFDVESNSIIPSKIKLAEKTRLNAKLVRVHIDNDTYVDCTPDHHFLLRDGTEIQAQNLKAGDSLRTINRRILNRLNINKDYWENNILSTAFNHKVISVEFLDDRIDTYNMEVDDKNHNYLIDNQIVIKNSTLAAEDIRFARTIERVQKIVISELTKMSIIHLFAQGYRGEELIDFTIELTSPSIIYEREKVELLTSKTTLARDMADLKMLGHDKIYKEVFNMSDEDIANTKKEVIKDTKFKFRIEQIEQEGNDPLITGESFGTPHDLASLDVEDEGDVNVRDAESVVDNSGNSGREKEGDNYDTQKHPAGRDPIGKTGVDNTLKQPKEKIKHTFKNNQALSTESKEMLKKLKLKTKGVISESLKELIENVDDDDTSDILNEKNILLK